MAHRVIHDWIVEKRQRVAYLVINDRVKPVAVLATERPHDGFKEVVTEHLDRYLNQHEMPPEVIQTAIINVADDFLAGNDLTFRAGDYIAIQNYAREHGLG